jgi:hypothetical protein
MKKLLAVTICFMFVGVGSLSAQTQTSTLLKKHTFEVGPEISYRTYREPDVMKEKGMMYGLMGSYTYHSKIMLKAEGRFSLGSVDYSNSGKIDDIEDFLLEIRGLGGYDFFLPDLGFITPFMGIGYRYLDDDSSGERSTTGYWGYDRESNYIYSPIGVSFITGLWNGWSFGATGEFDYFWWGKQKSHLSDVPGYYDISNRQKKGYGLRGSIIIQERFRNIDFRAEPFIRYWNIKNSEITVDPLGRSWIEPKNNSTEIGIMLGVRF